jgi:hypothetical protein
MDSQRYSEFKIVKKQYNGLSYTVRNTTTKAGEVIKGLCLIAELAN